MRAAALFVVVSVFASSLVVSAAARAAGPELRLHRMVVASALTRSSYAQLLSAPTGDSSTIIQFRSPITPDDRAALERTGVRILEYLPDFAYLVRGDSAQLDAAALLPQVYARVPLTPADKLAPALLRTLARGEQALGKVRVIGWPGDSGAVARDLRAASFQEDAPITVGALLRIAALPSVRWIEPAGRPRLLNDVARSIMHVDSAWQGRGLYGSGQIIAVADSGLDTGANASLSADFSGRIIATHVLSEGGDLGDQLGHGTHVTGSVAGAGVQSGANPAAHQYAGSFAGVAPEAGLVIQAFEANPLTGEIIGLDPDYYKLFADAYADGARLHTDSWGDFTGPESDAEAKFGGYPFGARRTDQFVWEHPDMAMFFAAGNFGQDGTPTALGLCGDGNGVIDSDSLLYPATAKNVISVGATESQRSSGGFSEQPWLLFGFLTGGCYAAAPIALDLTSNNPDGMAAFSSRGPTDDGRIKPDIVAPGMNIVSDKTLAPNADPASSQLWGAYATNPNYVYSGGTSMAAPLAAGSGVLVRQWLTSRGFADPSAAAVKAVLLNTAHDLAPGQYGGGATQEIPAARPNSVDGWGRADLSFMSAAPPYLIWVDDHTGGIATNQVVDYTSTSTRPLQVLDSSQPLRVMLTWSDPPASLSAARQLVNDLDLTVIGPNGATYYGNNIATGDRINNVEGIVINNPPVGQYTLKVRGYNVPIAAQPYALAVAGALSNTGQLAIAKAANPAAQVAPGGLITYTLALSANRPIAQAVTVADTLPLHTTFVGASNGGVQQGAVVEWVVPSIAAGATVTRTLVVRVDAAVADNTLILNADYRATNGSDLPGSGPPVGVLLRRAAPAGEHKLYLGLLAR